MARLIVKSPYIQCGKQNAGGYLRYIATGERVEIIPDDRPPTRKQEQQTVGYMKYIATRPRVERLGDQGLFGDVDHVDLGAAMSELEHYTGNVWTHILSLHREDAERLGYNNAQAWRALLRAHRNDIAAAMHIPPQDFRWYAAFHDEGHHPHVHMMAWSVKLGQAHLDRDGIRSIHSRVSIHFFAVEVWCRRMLSVRCGGCIYKRGCCQENFLQAAASFEFYSAEELVCSGSSGFSILISSCSSV